MDKKIMIEQLEEAMKWIEMFKRVEPNLENAHCLNQAIALIANVQKAIAEKEDSYFK